MRVLWKSNGAVAGAVLLVLAVPSIAGAAPAAQEPVQASSARTPSCSHPCSPSPGKGWKYQDYFFYESDCKANGRHGVDNHAWKKYQCKGGDTFTDYDLWVLP